MRDSPHLTNTLLNINEVSARAVHVGWASVCGSTNQCSWAYRLATSYLPDMQLSINDVSVGAVHVGRFTCVVHTNLGGGIAHVHKTRSRAHRSPRRGETRGYIHRNIQEGVSHEL